MAQRHPAHMHSWRKSSRGKSSQVIMHSSWRGALRTLVLALLAAYGMMGYRLSAEIAGTLAWLAWKMEPGSCYPMASAMYNHAARKQACDCVRFWFGPGLSWYTFSRSAHQP